MTLAGKDMLGLRRVFSEHHGWGERADTAGWSREGGERPVARRLVVDLL